jgi:hypothetical protein
LLRGRRRRNLLHGQSLHHQPVPGLRCGRPALLHRHWRDPLPDRPRLRGQRRRVRVRLPVAP